MKTVISGKKIKETKAPKRENMCKVSNKGRNNYSSHYCLSTPWQQSMVRFFDFKEQFPYRMKH
jgi:hypothetical protein